MWLEAKRVYSLIRYEPDNFVVRWTFDVRAAVEDPLPGEPLDYVVGRLLADELRRWEIEECGVDVWDAADADSSGLEAAWAAVLDEKGRFREEEFDNVGDPLVYLYRFELHPDFPMWRMAVMDAFCRTFNSNALVLAQHHTTWLTDTEFQELGFRLLSPTRFPAPPGFPDIDRSTRFMVRDNACATRFSLADYPDDAPAACRSHADWIESKGPWTGLI